MKRPASVILNAFADTSGSCAAIVSSGSSCLTNSSAWLAAAPRTEALRSRRTRMVARAPDRPARPDDAARSGRHGPRDWGCSRHSTRSRVTYRTRSAADSTVCWRQPRVVRMDRRRWSTMTPPASPALVSRGSRWHRTASHPPHCSACWSGSKRSTNSTSRSAAPGRGAPDATRSRRLGLPLRCLERATLPAAEALRRACVSPPGGLG